MKSLKEYILEARKNGVAVGHFNVCTIDGIWAVADAAQELKVPVIVNWLPASTWNGQSDPPSVTVSALVSVLVPERLSTAGAALAADGLQNTVTLLVNVMLEVSCRRQVVSEPMVRVLVPRAVGTVNRK